MGKNKKDSSIQVGLPIIDEYLNLSYDEIASIINNSSFERKYAKQFDEYLHYLESFSGVRDKGMFFKYMSIDVDETTNSCVLIFSYTGLYYSILNMLNGFPYGELSIEDLKKRVRKLKSIRTEKELKENFPFFYNDVYKDGKEQALANNLQMVVTAYELVRNDFIKYNLLKEKYKERGLDLDEEYLYAKSCFDLPTFIKCSVKYFLSIIDNFEEIKKWLPKHPIRVSLSRNDLKKLYLYIIYRELENMSVYLRSNDRLHAQKNVVIIEKLIEKYKTLYPNDNTVIQFKRRFNVNLNIKSNEDPFYFRFSLIDLENLFEKEISKYPFLHRNVTLPEAREDLSMRENMYNISKYLQSMLDETIDEDKENGAKDISDEEVEKKIQKLENDNPNLKKLIHDKYQMILKEIKTEKKLTGIGLFRNYWVYYYPNGMVAIDNPDGYGALYIMPVHIYKIARYKKNLTEVRFIPGVQPVEHRKKDWLDDARKYILEGTSELTEKDIIEASEVASIDFPYTIEQLEQLEKELAENGKLTKKTEEEVQKRVARIKKLEDIDSELKSSPNYDMSKDEFNSEEEEISECDMTFEELYDFWKKKHQNKKVKRNPVVAVITKKRARNAEGDYCCELCDYRSYRISDVHSHHMIPLGMGGVDNIYNTVSLCPNCHTAIHKGGVTLAQQAKLFRIIAKHLEDDNPEYLYNYYEMISPIAKDDEDYKARKDIIDSNFEVEWNSHK